ncbi:MAG: hypothetical protein J2P36_29275, partial [Ktedonobacteraceae bacterium]|nr:hypothetical protein [Ktedonobacteraceae bacterium]
MDAIRIQSKQKRKSDAGEGRKRGGKRRGRIYVRNAARGALLLLFLLGLALSLLPQGRGFARSALLLPALVSASEPPLLVASGEQVRHRQMTVPSSNGTVYLDLYEPSGSTPALSAARGGILIVPGAGDNRQVPQLINLSRALARTGLVVMDMVTPTLMNYDLSAQDSDAVVQAFRALARQPGMEGRRIGMLAFSAGVPLTSFAAADERIRDQVAFMAVFGGYFQTESLLRAFGRRAIDIDGKTEHWQPTEVPIQVMGNMITQALPPAESE